MLEMIISTKELNDDRGKCSSLDCSMPVLQYCLLIGFFPRDAVLMKYSGVLVVTFTVMFSLPFRYYLIRN